MKVVTKIIFSLFTCSCPEAKSRLICSEKRYLVDKVITRLRLGIYNVTKNITIICMIFMKRIMIMIITTLITKIIMIT